MQKRILVIEDDELVMSMLCKVLETEGYTVVRAENGAIGIKKFQEGGIDLVITDLIMPEKEGIETIRELKALDPQVNIIAISGGGILAPEQYLAIAKRLGVQRTFAKPFSRDEILAAVLQLCA
ncbi:MAG: response regulator [Desulfobacterota bacterium]|nr:response regulator [Thermodesulfobacteriota bacterium]